MIYGVRSNGKKHGLVLTRPLVVETILDRANYTPNRDLRNVKVIEPAAGDGAFATIIVHRLYLSAVNFNFCFRQALANLIFFELDEEVGESLKINVHRLLKTFSVDDIPVGLIRIEDFLLSKTDKCDLIVGNPPYVRHEKIPQNSKELYRKLFPTFKHRSDLYIAFYDKSLRLLNKNGVLSFICSNRWLKNQYGESLRRLINLKYSLDEIIDLEKTNPFEEEVIAYPAITTIRHSLPNKQSTYYSVHHLNQLENLDKGSVLGRGFDVSNPASWFISSELNEVQHSNLSSIEDQGFQIGIGIATGLDKVFIRDDFQSKIENELLMPIVLAKDLKGNELKWSGNHLLNPYDHTGKLIDLSKFPKAKMYLELHRDKLESRHIAKKRPELWYKTIDRVNPRLLHEMKILLPDISGNNHIMIDEGNLYPHHNIYYITSKNTEIKKVKLLAAILSSDFIKKQLIQLGTTMNGGYPRWQSQTLRKLRIPIVDAIPESISSLLLKAYEEMDFDKINKLVGEIEQSKFAEHMSHLTKKAV